MEYSVVAFIKWISYEDGGRKKVPPKNTKYCPIIKFDDIDMDGDWSILFYCTEINEHCEEVVNMKFLSDNAPSELLISDRKFALYEGRKMVAKGYIK